MSYTPNNTFSDIPLTGVLIPGITEGFITDSKYIKGGYIVVKDTTERDALTSTAIYEDKVLTIGTPVFVSDENKTYRYLGEGTGPDIWQEDTADLQNVYANISGLQQTILDVNEQLQTKATAESVDALSASVNSTTSAIEANLNTLSQTVDEQATQIEQKVSTDDFSETVSALNNSIANKASIEDLSSISSQINAIGSEGIWNDNTPTTETVGNLEAGTNLYGKTIKEILSMMLYSSQIINPTYTDYSLSVSVDPIIGIASTTVNINGTITFNRGEILLNGVAQGNRLGSMVNYQIDGGTPMPVSIDNSATVQTATFSYNYLIPTYGRQTVTLTANYNEGDQPKNNFDTNVGEPMPAGSLQTTFTVTGLTNTYTGNETSSGEIAQLDNIILGSIITDPTIDAHQEVGMFEDIGDNGEVTGAGYQIRLPETTYNSDYTQEYAPIVLIPDGIALTGIKSWDGLASAWNWYEGETAEESLSAGTFVDTGETITKEVNSAMIKYHIYKCTETVIGDKYFRFYVA